MDPDEPLSQPTDAPTRPLNQHDTSNEDPAVLFHQLKATTPDSGIMELGEDGKIANDSHHQLLLTSS